MVLGTNDKGFIELRKVFNPIILISDTGEKLSICMRDSGFEILYGKKRIDMKEGSIDRQTGNTTKFSDETEIPQTDGGGITMPNLQNTVLSPK